MHPRKLPRYPESPRSRHGGRHELGQNFLVDTATVRTICDLVARTEGPLLELGAGDGALTIELARLGRDLRAIEIDEHRARRLRQRLPRADIRAGDALRVPLDRAVIVGNIPFHITTPLLRRLLTQGSWQHAILLTQWEVARKRVGVGGGTMLTAQTAPWFAFALADRVPRHAFRPIPSVDGGVLVITRRAQPLIPTRERRPYAEFVRRVFTGRGHGIREVLAAVTGQPRRRIDAALSGAGLRATALPRDLDAEQWTALWNAFGARP